MTIETDATDFLRMMPRPTYDTIEERSKRYSRDDQQRFIRAALHADIIASNERALAEKVCRIRFPK